MKKLLQDLASNEFSCEDLDIWADRCQELSAEAYKEADLADILSQLSHLIKSLKKFKLEKEILENEKMIQAAKPNPHTPLFPPSIYPSLYPFALNSLTPHIPISSSSSSVYSTRGCFHGQGAL